MTIKEITTTSEPENKQRRCNEAKFDLPYRFKTSIVTFFIIKSRVCSLGLNFSLVFFCHRCVLILAVYFRVHEMVFPYEKLYRDFNTTNYTAVCKQCKEKIKYSKSIKANLPEVTIRTSTRSSLGM